MATTLYLRNTTTNGITDTGDAVVYDMVITAGAAADEDVVTLVASGTEIQWTQTAGGSSIAFISGRVPSGGFTLTTGTFSGWGNESNKNDNAAFGVRVIRYQPGPTITEIGGPFEDTAEFNGTTYEERSITCNVTDTAFSEDDRILVRVYAVDKGGTMTAGTANLKFNAAAAAEGDSFFSINENVTFKTESTPVNVSATCDAMVLTENSATINAETNVNTVLKQLALTTFAAAVALAINVQATTASLTCTPNAATIKSDINITAGTDVLAITANAATVKVDTNVIASADALVVLTYGADVSLLVMMVSANTANLVLMTQPATINAATNVLAEVESLIVSTYSADVQVGAGASKIRIGDIAVAKIYLGSNLVGKVYLGSVNVL